MTIEKLAMLNGILEELNRIEEAEETAAMAEGLNMPFVTINLSSQELDGETFDMEASGDVANEIVSAAISILRKRKKLLEKEFANA